MTNDTRETALAELHQYSKDARERARARAVNAARDAGLTWAEIAAALEVAVSGVDRLKYVDSVYNRTRDLPTDPDDPRTA